MTAIHIAHGAHRDPAGEKCTAEWRFILCQCERCCDAKAAGLKITDCPPCSPATIARVIPLVNDRLTDEGKQRMASRIPLIPSVGADADPAMVERVERRVALWCARSVEHLSTDPRVKACNDVTERWLAGEASDSELAEAAEAAGAAWAARAAGAAGAAEAAEAAGAAWAARAAWAAEAAGAAWAARAARAARAAWAARAARAAEAAWAADDALLDWLDRLLDAWAKIAADEGLMGSCDWLDPATFAQAGGS